MDIVANTEINLKKMIKKKKNKKMKIKTTPQFEHDLKRLFSLNPIYSIPRFFDRLKYEIKWAYQRLIRGYDDRWFWSFNHQLADFAIEIFKHMSKKAFGHPSSITFTKWQKILMKIAEGFEAYKEINEGDSYMIPTGYYHQEGLLKGMEKRVVDKRKLKTLEKKQKKGLELFTKWFNHLWD